MSKRNEMLESLFEAAAALETESQRADYLNRACPDPELRREVASLLAAHENPDSFFAEKTILVEGTPSEKVGQTLGRYKLLESVGEGGCGVVYVAEQTEPVRRRVALKVIKLGMDTRAVVARFEAERQALAMMDHPNIAKVFDAGTTETGRPYFVMELVRGIRVTEYCDQNNLSTRERLDLFIKICHAVQHAHQKGIIHRDIKPSNILVTLHDGVPVPKVIDFGIAKATEGRLTDATVYTQLHQFIGTPAYMSPEQAEMSGLDIDTRSDIYSLGVLLYEMLAGSTPFDATELMASGLDAMRKTIREKEPVRPSTRLATLGADQLTTTAKRRSADTSKLLHQLKGDLDWIVMKCLEKDRSRRYETANGIAADLKRHLNNEPVTACPPSAAYRCQKAFRRNKLVFTAAGIVAAALVLGIAVSTWQMLRAHAAEQMAEERLLDSEEARRVALAAQENAKKANQAASQEMVRSTEITEAIEGIIEDSLPGMVIKGQKKSAQALLLSAEKQADLLKESPLTELRLRRQLLGIYTWAFENNAGMHRQASRIEALLTLLSSNPQITNALEIRVEIAEAGLWAGQNQTLTRYSDADPKLDALYAEAAAIKPPNAAFLARILATQGGWRYARADFAGAANKFQKIVQLFRELGSPSQTVPQPFFDARNAWVDYARCQAHLDAREEAIKQLQSRILSPGRNLVDLIPAMAALAPMLIAYQRGAEANSMLLSAWDERNVSGASPAQTQRLRMLQALVLIQSGQSQKGIQCLMPLVSEQDTSFATWIQAASAALATGDETVVGHLVREGVTRYTGNAEDDYAINLCVIILASRPGPDLLAVARQVVDRFNQSKTESHWSNYLAPGMNALMAYREGDFKLALGKVNERPDVHPDQPGGLLLKYYEGAFDGSLQRALIHAQLGQPDEARAAYERGMQGLEAFWSGPDAYDHPTVTSHALVMRALAREAETLLKEKGILPQNSGFGSKSSDNR